MTTTPTHRCAATALSLIALSLLATLPARSASVIPGPDEESIGLTGHAARYDRQFHTFNAARFGLSLDLFIDDPADRDRVAAFLDQSATDDFAAVAGVGVDQIVTRWDEHGDLGMFAGVPAAADAFRYLVLKREGAAAEELSRARADLLDAIEAMHVYANITGRPGAIARGIGTDVDVAELPVAAPASCEDPWTRQNTWRSDGTGHFSGWLWQDNTSKDQLLGYVFALGAFADAVADDPSVDDDVRTRLREDARALGALLREPVEVASGESLDLVITDLAGCPTRFHDLNPREVIHDGPSLVLGDDSSARNGFNAAAALGIVRTLVHVSGDVELAHWYYEELVAQRGYPALLTSGLGRLRQMFANTCVLGDCLVTNFSNVNMAFVAMFGLLRYESEPTLRAQYRAALASDLWDTGRPHDGLASQQAFFNVMWAGLKAGASDTAAADAAATQLRAFPSPPWFDVAVENCDAGEIAAGSCLAVDGVTTIVLDAIPSRGGGVAAVDPVPMALRPPSDFSWRSDPRNVNGGGSSRLNPGGCFRGAYWLGRVLERADDNDANLSPWAHDPRSSGGEGEGEPGEGEGEGEPGEGEGEGDPAEGEGEGEPAEGEGEGDVGGEPGEGEGEAADGCRCASSGGTAEGGLPALLLLGAWAAWRAGARASTARRA